MRMRVQAGSRSAGVSGLSGAKGFSVVLRALIVKKTASGILGAAKALSTSSDDWGVPWMMVRLGFDERSEGMEAGLRTRAVTVWEDVSAVWRVRRPVRPDAPRMRKCMSVCGGGVMLQRCVDDDESELKLKTLNGMILYGIKSI